MTLKFGPNYDISDVSKSESTGAETASERTPWFVTSYMELLFGETSIQMIV